MQVLPSILLVPILGATIFAQSPVAQSSPAEDRISFINREIAKTPGKPNLQTELAIALLRRERETSNKALFDQAQAALDESLKLAPTNLEAQKIQTALLLGKHEFASALTLAKRLNQNVPDDVMIYGYIADADLALGNYADAEKAAQWMLDLRTNNVPGLIRGAELRQIFGDSEGALQFLSDSYQQTSPDQPEDIAWLLTRMAEIDLSVGKLDSADQLLEKALSAFPNYYLSLELRARVLEGRHKYAQAADLLHLRNQHFADPESIYAEGEALEQAGTLEKAKELYATFEQTAQTESGHGNNDNQDLTAYYLVHKHDIAEALRVARLTISQRHDVWTLESYATVLYADGDYLEAQKQIEQALASGVHDADIFYHAAQIDAALKDKTATIRYLKASLDANPESSVSNNARKMLVEFADTENGRQKH
jgi:tetratricopeptide (TPR) repeat protein